MDLGSIYTTHPVCLLLKVLIIVHSSLQASPSVPASALQASGCVLGQEPQEAEMKAGGGITIALFVLLLLLHCGPGMATPSAAEVEVHRYTHGLGMWVCTAYARPGPIDRATCDWMCRLSNNSTTSGGLQVRLGDDYSCCEMGCRCSFCVSVYTVGSAGHGMRAAAAAAVWPIALSSLLVLAVMLV